LEGLAYVPLHPLHPIERNQEIIEQAEIKMVLSSDTAFFSKVKMIETNKLVFENYLLEQKEVDDNALACILFTSGSTGIPKGVPLIYGNVNAYVQSFWAAGYILDETDKFLQPFNLNFIASMKTYLIPISIGACVYTVPHNQIKFSYITKLLEEHALTFAFMNPSIIRHLKPYFDEISLPFLRYSLFGGEPMHLDLAQEWSKCVPNALIDNLYGSTESTGLCFVYHFVRNGNNKSHNGLLSIGKPTADQEMIIIDDTDKPVANNMRGELCIAGKQITPGYWKNPDKNLEIFFIHKNARFYRTGDIAYKDEEGDILICGRVDAQVKVQGFRIELGEIEYHARQFLSGTNVVCITYERIADNTEIGLFIESSTCDLQALTTYLQSKLPAYMVPKTIMCCDKFPLNTNGKTDKTELRKMIK
jgi:acyl-coenzyme A synthetase/AMP-(fatty) acid ligase